MGAKSKVTASAQEVEISDRTWNGSQSWYRVRIAEIGGVRLRYALRCNAYKAQSYAEVEVWRDEWRTIERIAGEQMRSNASYVDGDVKPSAFDADLSELRRVAYAVLGIK